MSDLSIGFFGAPLSLGMPQWARVHRVAEWLRSHGYRAELLGLDGFENVDVAILCGPYDEPHLDLMRNARAASCRMIFDVSEDLPEFESPWYLPMMQYTVVTGSPAIAARQRMLNPNVFVIEDAVEGDLDAIGEQWLSLIRREPVVDIVAIHSAGGAAAVNRGIAAGNAPYICLSNDDTIATRGWLEPLLDEVRQRPGIYRAATGLVLPRALYDSVGSFDEGFMDGGEVVDFSLRAKRLGFAVSIDERGAGGDRDRERLRIKYEKPLVMIHTGGALEPWTARTLDETGIGGSETAAVHMASELAKVGHRVVVFTDCPAEETIDGVEYLHYDSFWSFIGCHHAEVFITSRNAALLDAPVRARRRYLWIHDALPWHSDRLAPNYEKLDAIFCLSPWHRDYLMRELRIGPEKLMITRNGIDPERFPANIRRRKHRFIYSSSLDRGLDTLLEIFPRIRTELPDAELHVYYGFDHWEKMLAVTRSQESLAYIQRLKTQLSQPGVFYHGRIGQKQLAEEMVRSDVWLYPTRWSEGYCITALEAMAAGVLCICTDLGALTTTVGSRGILLKGDAYSEEYRREAVETTLSLLRNRRKRNAITARAREWARQQTWSALAREWTGLFGTEVGDYRSPAAV